MSVSGVLVELVIVLGVAAVVTVGFQAARLPVVLGYVLAGPIANQVLVAAEVRMADGLSGAEVAAALAVTRADLGREVPAIARLYLTPVGDEARS